MARQRKLSAAQVGVFASLALSVALGSADTPAPRNVLPDVGQTASFTLQDGPGIWSPIGPVESRYVVQREDKWFNGQARFSARDEKSGRERKAEASVNIPLAVAQAAFQILATAPLKEEEYVPDGRQTDYFPHIEWALKVKANVVTFYTDSQGENHVPWAVKFGGKTYVIHSDAPARAYKLLLPYLKKDVLKDMMDEAYRH